MAGPDLGRTALAAGLAGLPALLRRHWLFAGALGLAVVPRVIVMAGFAPAALFKLDTYDYLWDATHLMPNPVNPSGYSVFLWLLWPFHSLVLIAALQHLMGLGIAVMIYAVLRRRGVSGWLATLAGRTGAIRPGPVAARAADHGRHPGDVFS